MHTRAEAYHSIYSVTKSFEHLSLKIDAAQDQVQMAEQEKANEDNMDLFKKLDCHLSAYTKYLNKDIITKLHVY